MKRKFNYDVDVILTSRNGNRYEHAVRVQASSVLEAKTMAAMEVRNRNQDYFVVAKSAYLVGAALIRGHETHRLGHYVDSRW